MKAVELQYKSGEDSIIEVMTPTAIDSEVLVKVKYSAIDTGTNQVVQKTLNPGYFVHKWTTPLILGWHYSGTIEAVGPKAKNLKVGDEVWGFLQYEPQQTQGTFAEYVTVKEEDCARIPEGIELKELTAASTECLTALQAIRDLGGLSENKSILVLGAGGGVGSAAVQIAKQLGARVTAVCSSKDVERVKDFGADVVLDRTTQSDKFFSKDTKYDVIFDTPSKYSPWRSFQFLNPRGVFVVTLPSMGLLGAMVLSFFNGQKAAFVECHSKRQDLELVGGWLSNGSLKIDVDSTYAVKDIRKALERQGNKAKVGRVVIQVEGGW